MLDPKAHAAEERAQSARIRAACEAKIEGVLCDTAASLEIRKDVAGCYLKQLNGEPLSLAEKTMLAYFQAGLLVE